MIIDAHVHLLSFPSFADLSEQIRTTEDLVAFRTRYPALYQARVTESAVDNSDALIADMDRYGVAKALVQAVPGQVSNDAVAAAAQRHPDRLIPLLRLGHDQEAAGYLPDPAPARKRAADEVERCLTTLQMKGVGELFVRALTTELDPEKIARDLDPVMEVLAAHGRPIQFPTAWSQFPGGLYYGNPIFVDEIAPRYPDVPIILTKMGRSIQYYFDMALTVALRNVNVYFDVVGTSGPHLRLALDKLGPARIMFGTDWSATWRWVREPAPLHLLRLKVLEDAQVSDAEREQLLWGTASRVFRLESTG